MRAPRPRRRALVVDDEPASREFVTMALEFEDVDVDAAADRVEALELLGRHDYDCVVLDVDMPTGSGITFLGELRRDHDLAIVMHSAFDDSALVVTALEAGADEYVRKPVTPRELLLRVIRAIERRPERQLEPVPTSPVVIAFEQLTIDPYCRIAVLRDDELDLTAKEFDLLVAFATEPGRVFSREELLRGVWGSEPDWQSLDTVTEHVYRLRQKLDEPGTGRSWIQTLRGAGYRFERRRVPEPGDGETASVTMIGKTAS